MSSAVPGGNVCNAPGPRRLRIAVVGAGVAGICMGAKLKAAGFDDFVVYERSHDVGGVWQANTYPGLSCDIPSRNYEFSFAPNPDWSKYFSDGAEIRRYLGRVTDEHGLRAHLRLGREVTRAAFEDGRWTVETSGGATSRFDLLLCATGLLVRPRRPGLPGEDSFTGTAFHSAEWNHSAVLVGRRVAVIGTGSTGTQLTCSLAGQAQKLTLFQRTPQWVFPKPNKRYTTAAKALHHVFPRLSGPARHFWRVLFDRTVSRAALAPGWQRALLGLGCVLALRRIRSPELRARLTPDHPPMCKRLVVASGFHRAVQRRDVEVVTEPVARITPAGLLTRDGREHEVDVIVYATGFHTDYYMRPMRIVGADGLTLEQAWSSGPRAYRTVALPGFPNLFMLVGPHSPFANESVVRTAETQADYIMKWVALLSDGVIAHAAPTEQATEAFNTSLAAALPRTTFALGCTSWYHDRHGALMIWPLPVSTHRELLAEVHLGDFEVTADITAPPEPESRSARR